MPRLNWQTLATGRRYIAESMIGVRLEIVMGRYKGRDTGFVLYIANEMYITREHNPDKAKDKAGELYCKIIAQEFRRVCH